MRTSAERTARIAIPRCAPFALFANRVNRPEPLALYEEKIDNFDKSAKSAKSAKSDGVGYLADLTGRFP